jgi:hypothetical protein
MNESNKMPMALCFLRIHCARIETTTQCIEDQHPNDEEKEQLHQLVCRLETIATKLRSLQAKEPSADLPEIHCINGICCGHCLWFETKKCPIKESSGWSRWCNFCNCYAPNPAIPEAQPFSALLKPNSI